MRCILVNTGTELLLGDVQDTHLAFIAKEILLLGLRLSERRTVGDGPVIAETLRDLFPRAELIFVTGGLGPTTDDITREVTAELLGLALIHDENIMSVIKERFRKRGIKFTNRISRQANVPEGATVLPNENGTAPGLYLRQNINPAVPTPHLFLLPGPPREMHPMFRNSVTSILREIAPTPSFVRRQYRLANIGESIVERAVGMQILSLPEIELGYCARPSEVDVRIIGPGDSVKKADAIIREKLNDSIFSTDDESLEEVLVKLLASRKETLAVAESCTGGLLANRITNVSGASNVLLAGYVTYANSAKNDVLNVDPQLLEEQGSVSELVAKAMAEGARKRAQSTYALSTTGIAGPGGGTEEKPVGTVFVGLASPNETIVRKLFFPNDRITFKEQVAQAAFDLLRRKLL